MGRAIIRPINAEDIRNETYGAVRHQILASGSQYYSDQQTADSPTIFGAKSKDDLGIIKPDIYNRRGYIPLAIPVVNFFLAGGDLTIMKLVTGCKELVNIAEGMVIYDKSDETFYNRKDMATDKPFTDDILIGGELIKYLLSRVDIEREIKRHIAGFAYNLVKRIEGFTDENVGTVTESHGEIWVVDNFYFNPSEEAVKAIDLSAWSAYFKENRRLILEGSSKKLTYLIALRRNGMNVIIDQVMDNLVVVPIGYRPTVDRKKDKLTKAYNKVVSRNNDLSRALKISTSTCSDVMLSYKELVGSVRNVMTKKEPYESEDYKPIAEILKGKEGHIRDKMQGTRSDYTGRAVIVVDPYMSVNTIGIPRAMAEKLMELHVVSKFETKKFNKSDVFRAENKQQRIEMACKLLEGKSAVLGRQPTLYYLGLRGWIIVIVEGSNIVLNPLSCPAYNADFDGDQTHVSVPMTPEAQHEVNTIMDSTNNLFLSRSGETHIAPRQEILYGLYQATILKPNAKSNSYTIPDTMKARCELLDKVCSQEWNVYDKVTIGGEELTAGLLAVRACFGSTYGRYRIGVLPLTTDSAVPEKVVSEGWFKQIIKLIAVNNKDKFVDIIDKLVKLGFAVANIYPPNINILKFPDVKPLIDDFETRIAEREEYYNMGFETSEGFSTFYDKEYTVLESKVKKLLVTSLGPDNGYMLMVNSKARGSMSNVLQLFGMKGRVMKNADEAFNVMIRHSLAEQLTGLEHFATAYGSREGVIEKVISTYEPGYLSRQMSHDAPFISIKSQDCHTTNGIRLTYDTILQFLPEYVVSDQDVINNVNVKDYTSKLLVGRCIVGVSNMVHTLHDAEVMYDTYIAEIKGNKLVKKEGILLRSPITCEDPCCVKCYGLDLCTNAMSVEGLPIGYIAAQSIGEPGTQLTMKNFQKGGVAGSKNLTSSFDKMDKYLHLYDLQSKNKSKPIAYDYISPFEGDLKTILRGDGTKELQILGPNAKGKIVNKLRSKVVLYEDVVLKDHVQMGESIQKVQGDLSIREIVKYRSVEEAQVYLALMLYDIFQKEVDVNLKHFETIIAGMTHRFCVRGNKYFKAGSYYTVTEYMSNDTSGAEFELDIIGIKSAPGIRNDVFSTMFMENIQAGVERSIILSGEDSMTNPLVRTSFGLRLGIGSDVPYYTERRGTV